MKLLDNGLDSFKKSILKLSELDGISKDEYEFSLKDIVINLHHSLETIFKYLIMKKDEFLVYEDLNSIFNVKVQKLYGKKGVEKFNTIKFIDALNRLIILYELDINEVEYNKIKQLNDYRNILTHFEYQFEDNEIEHLISLILPTVFNIFDAYVDDFGKFAIQNNIYSNTKLLIDNTDIWSLEKSIFLKQEFTRAKNYFEQLMKNSPDKIKQVFENKDKKFEYMNCPSCKKETFVKLGNLIDYGRDIGYYGSCELCEISFKKDDAQFLSMYTTSYEKFEEEIYSISKMLVLRIFTNDLPIENKKQDDIRKLREIYQSYSNEIDLIIVDIINYYIYDINYILGDIYFIKYMYGNLEYGEKIIYGEKLYKYVNGPDYYDLISHDHTVKEIKSKLSLIRDNYDYLSDGKFDLIQKRLLKETYCYQQMSYPNPHMDNEEVEG